MRFTRDCEEKLYNSLAAPSSGQPTDALRAAQGFCSIHAQKKKTKACMNEEGPLCHCSDSGQTRPKTPRVSSCPLRYAGFRDSALLTVSFNAFFYSNDPLFVVAVGTEG